MTACTEVKKWMTEKVQVPVEEKITEARKECNKAKRKIEEKVRKPIENWVSKQERKCKKKKCKWWCACCNKWFCWIATIVVKVVTWIVTTIIKWVTYLVCKIVMFVVDIIVKLVLRIIKFLVSFFVCLFTDIEGWGLAFADLWTDVLDILENIIDFVESLLDDINELIDDIIRLLDSLASSFGPLGTWLFGILAGALRIIKKVVDIVREIINSVQDIVFGILRLNLCRIEAGITNLGTSVGRAILTIVGAFFGTTVGGPREGFWQDSLQEIIIDALNEEFGSDPDRIERAEDLIHLYSRPFGLPMKLDPRRMVIRSSEFLRDLHLEGIINLYAIAGHLSDCNGEWSTSTKRKNGEVVYTGTRTTVSYSDLNLFLKDGPSAVPEFSVYPVRYDNFERYLYVAREKGYQLGVEFFWDDILDYEITDNTFLPLITSDNDELFTPFGRNGTTDDLSNIPVLAIFLYVSPDLNGLASWFRPPPYSNDCPISKDTPPRGQTYARKSGVSFIDRNPEYVFKFVAIHEIGHYLGLCHEDHDGFEFIMFSNKEAKSKVTDQTVMEYLLLGGDPYFTQNDAREVWEWLTQVAKDSCLP
ncbi:MAG: hypothetical protein OEZ02_05365 [Anaerolineae bacterium]|nr:hypothetical protein [Anaerolineae bacterium]